VPPAGNAHARGPAHALSRSRACGVSKPRVQTALDKLRPAVPQGIWGVAYLREWQVRRALASPGNAQAHAHA